MRAALIVVLFTSACSDPAQAVADMFAPLPVRGAPPPSTDMQRTLCCVGMACVQPRLRQMQCDSGTEQIECTATTRIARLGPLWACQ